MKFQFAAPLFVLAAIAAQAQTLKIPESFDKLASKAREVVDIKLDENLLTIAGKSHQDKETHVLGDKKHADKIKGGFIRSYEFDKEGEYSQADVEAIRNQLSASGWNCMVNVRNNKKGETAQVCFHSTGGNGDGIAILAAEPKELTIINLTGTGDLADLGSLGDHIRVPDVSFTNKQ